MPVAIINGSGGLAHGEGLRVPFPPDFVEMQPSVGVRKDAWNEDEGGTDRSFLRVGWVRFNLSSLAIGSINSVNLLLSLQAGDYGWSGATQVGPGGTLEWRSNIHHWAAEWMEYVSPVGSEIYAADDSLQDAVAEYDMSQHSTTGDTLGDSQAVDLSIPLLNAATELVEKDDVALRLVATRTPLAHERPAGWIGSTKFTDGFSMFFRGISLEIDYEEPLEDIDIVEIEASSILILQAEIDVIIREDPLHHFARLWRDAYRR